MKTKKRRLPIGKVPVYIYLDENFASLLKVRAVEKKTSISKLVESILRKHIRPEQAQNFIKTASDIDPSRFSQSVEIKHS